MDTHTRHRPSSTARIAALLLLIVLAASACTSTPQFIISEPAASEPVVEPATSDTTQASASTTDEQATDPAVGTEPATGADSGGDTDTTHTSADTATETAGGAPVATGTSHLAAPCNQVRGETVASALGVNFTGGTTELFDELHCDLFATGEPAIPDTLAVSVIEVPNETIEFRYSDSDETVDIGGVTGYLDSFSGSVVVPAQSSDGMWGGFVVGVYGEDETAAERQAVMLALAAEMLANR